MTVLIFGRGFLGRRLAEVIDGAVLHSADIADEQHVRDALDEYGPSAVVNAAGKTGRPNVDWCESHPLPTYRTNVEGPLVLARVCRQRSVYLLHLASGCIFYGPSPSPGGWTEDDAANPLSFYSRTKYAADLVLSRLPNVGIARLRMPIDRIPGPRNLITKLASYPQVIDVENSVTVVDDLIAAIRGLLAERATGAYHLTNPGVMRHRELLDLYRELVDPLHRVTYIREEDLLARGLVRAARSNSLLSSDRLTRLGIRMRPIGEALRDTMEKYADAVRALPQKLAPS